MKKLLTTTVLAGLMAVSMSMTAFAGQWQQDAKGYWYQNDDGSYLKDGWNWVDGKCYYFAADGYCLIGTRTPDGYTVDSTGAWVVDGVVQTQAGGSATISQETVTTGSMTLVLPEGFVKESEEDGAIYLRNADTTIIIALTSQSMNGALDAEEQKLAIYLSDMILDAAMKQVTGADIAGIDKQFANGSWRFYNYAENTITDIPGTTQVYARFAGDSIQMVFFAGAISGMDTDSIMQNNLR